jgi:hypothetical protein
MVYETLLQYEEGDLARPNLEAGTALNWISRMFTYKGSMVWEVTGGMGDVLVAPLYEVLRKRGVRFHFFHRVQAMRLSPCASRVERVEVGVQAQTKGDYQALLYMDHTPVWPAVPRWEQLVEGDRLSREGANFESKWCTEPLVATKCLRHGEDFDDIVLALPLGAFKPLNEESSPCAELISANPRFAEMVEKIALAPTQALQVWFDSPLAQLGFDYRKPGCESELPAMVNGPGPFSIWADMTPVIRHEQWRGHRPRSVHYLCGMLHTDLYRRPSSDASVPARAAELVRGHGREWLERYAGLLWPAACRPGSWALDWERLHAPESARGLARLDTQFVKANVDPSDCAVTSSVGTSKYRLAAHESGFANLVLAGSWTKTPLCLECVEGAVMSGRAAARAISGLPALIPGEDWLRMGSSGDTRGSTSASSAAE